MTGGNAVTDDEEYGGGLNCQGNGGECSPTLTNLLFVDNYADFEGGALYLNGRNGGESQPLIRNAVFTNNTSRQEGAIYNEGYGGLSSPDVEGSVFVNNRATSTLASGGAMYNAGFDNETLDEDGESAPTGGDDYVIGQGATSSANQSLHVGFRDSDEFTIAFYGNDLDVSNTYTDTNWHHWAVTYDADTGDRTVYRDGIEVGSDQARRFSGNGSVLFRHSGHRRCLGRLQWESRRGARLAPGADASRDSAGHAPNARRRHGRGLFGPRQ